MSEELCHCGLPLHYKSKRMENIMCRLVKEQGRLVPVTVGKRTWLVPRHYIALHGIKGDTIHTLGFAELKK